MKTFNHLFVLGRPAAGKSELIDFLKRMSDEERAGNFHIGKFKEVDDFPWLWEVYQEDNEREKMGKERLFTEDTPVGLSLKDQMFRSNNQDKFNEVIEEKYLSKPEFYDDGTLLIEFARGKADGFKLSLEKMERIILEDAAILYIDVSFDESYRRNDARFQEAQKHSILFHKVPDHDMYEYFIENDWKEITSGRPSGHLKICGIDIPFVTMGNEPESTDPGILSERYGTALGRLWELKKNVP